MSDRQRPAWKRDPRKPNKKATSRKVAAKLVEAKTAFEALNTEFGRTGQLKRLGPADFKPIIVKLLCDHKPKSEHVAGVAATHIQSGATGQMYVSLHTQDPGEPAPKEVSGGGYARVKVPPRPFLTKDEAQLQLIIKRLDLSWNRR